MWALYQFLVHPKRRADGRASRLLPVVGRDAEAGVRHFRGTMRAVVPVPSERIDRTIAEEAGQNQDSRSKEGQECLTKRLTIESNRTSQV